MLSRTSLLVTTLLGFATPAITTVASMAPTAAVAAVETPASFKVRVEAGQTRIIKVLVGDGGILMVEGDGTGDIDYRLVDMTGRPAGRSVDHGDGAKFEVAPGEYILFAQNLGRFFSPITVTTN